MKAIIILFLSLFLINSAFASEKLINLYRDKAPPYDNGQKVELHIFLPEKDSTGHAIIMCSGGGYAGISKEFFKKRIGPHF